MSTLWTYGCSWTYSDIHKQDFNQIFWPAMVSNFLEMDLINRGFGGEGISKASYKLMKDLPSIKKDDIIVFEFSYPERLPLSSLNLNEKERFWDLFSVEKKLITNWDKNKIETYIDFIYSFRNELLIKEFINILPIFNYIEDVLGAKVKYWFLSIEHNRDTVESLEFIERTIWDEKRCITFYNINPLKRSFTHNIEAQHVITTDNLRICDDYTNEKIHEEYRIRTDNHPNQNGHIRIAECVLKSIDPDLNIENLPKPKEIKRKLL